MSYYLSYWDVLKSILILDSTMMLLCSVLAFAFFLVIKKMGWRQARWHILFVMALVMITLLGAALINKDAGWTLYENKLEVKGASIAETINLSEDKMWIVEANSAWQPVTRLHGFNSSGLYTGKFRLANQQEAMVFCHMP